MKTSISDIFGSFNLPYTFTVKITNGAKNVKIFQYSQQKNQVINLSQIHFVLYPK